MHLFHHFSFPPWILQCLGHFWWYVCVQQTLVAQMTWMWVIDNDRTKIWIGWCVTHERFPFPRAMGTSKSATGLGDSPETGASVSRSWAFWWWWISGRHWSCCLTFLSKVNLKRPFLWSLCLSVFWSLFFWRLILSFHWWPFWDTIITSLSMAGSWLYIGRSYAIKGCCSPLATWVLYFFTLLRINRGIFKDCHIHTDKMPSIFSW